MLFMESLSHLALISTLKSILFIFLLSMSLYFSARKMVANGYFGG